MPEGAFVADFVLPFDISAGDHEFKVTSCWGGADESYPEDGFPSMIYLTVIVAVATRSFTPPPSPMVPYGATPAAHLRRAETRDRRCNYQQRLPTKVH